MLVEWRAGPGVIVASHPRTTINRGPLFLFYYFSFSFSLHQGLFTELTHANFERAEAGTHTARARITGTNEKRRQWRQSG